MRKIETVNLLANETLTTVNDGIKLIQNPEGLTFGTDALMLAAFIRKMPEGVAAEFGSGSGIISLILAARGKLKKIYAIETQKYYVELTKRNIELNQLSERIEPIFGDARDFSIECDVIFTNPPYMKTTSGKRNCDDGKYAARHEVNGDIYDFCRSAAKCLKFGGLFYCVYRPDRAIDLLSAMREAKIEPKRLALVAQDTKHKPCLMLVEGKRGGKPSCDLLQTLFLCKDGTSLPTEDAASIYDTGEWSY
ncbi:MAG: methyltransferase [Clostridia bacterium]|nr:methyltransferase [Clostridia bacterium]